MNLESIGVTPFRFDSNHGKYAQAGHGFAIAQKRIVQERTPAAPKPELNQDAVLALETLGVPRNEAKRRILEAMGMFPDADTQALIVECLKPK